MSLLLWIKNKRGIRRYIGPKRVTLLLALIFFLFGIHHFYQEGSLSPEIIRPYLQLHPLGAVLLFILLYIISVIAAVPSIPLNLASGFFWGGFLGGLYSTIGMTIGGWIAFYFARMVAGQPFKERINNRWMNKVQHEFAKSGWKFVAFARINPIIPTGPLNYLLGLTSLSNKSFFLTTFIFLLPSAILIAYIGDTLQIFAVQELNQNEIVKGVLIVSAVLTFLFGLKLTSNIFKKTQDKI